MKNQSFKVSWFLGFLVSKFLDVLVSLFQIFNVHKSSNMLIHIDPILPVSISCFLQDIDSVLQIYKHLLNGSSYSALPIFQIELWSSKIFIFPQIIFLEMIRGSSLSSLEEFGVCTNLHNCFLGPMEKMLAMAPQARRISPY